MEDTSSSAAPAIEASGPPIAVAAAPASEAVPIRIVNTSSDAAALIADGTARLSTSVLNTMVAQISLTTEEARAFSKLQSHAQAHYGELLDNVKDLHTYNSTVQAHVSAIAPALKQLDELEAAVVELETLALGLRSHTQTLDAALQAVLKPVPDLPPVLPKPIDAAPQPVAEPAGPAA